MNKVVLIGRLTKDPELRPTRPIFQFCITGGRPQIQVGKPTTTADL